MIEFEVEKNEQEFGAIARIKVLGVGGAGGNTVNSIIASGYQGIEFIVANTDSQALGLSQANQKVQIGIKSTKGLGTGANPEVGKRAAEEDLDKIMEVVKDADIVFLAAGMGGGTGSGALPVIAKALKEKGILSIAIVTKPFLFEGKRRAKVADQAIQDLRAAVDTLIVIPNQKLLEVVDSHVSMIDAFAMINDVLSQSVRGISDIITKPGHINVDFADVRTIMKDRGLAVMGTGRATGASRAQDAALQAISSPLLENMSVEGAHGVLFNITGGKDLGLHEISQAASVIYDQADEDANIILGSVIDESLTDEVIVTIIATGFSSKIPVMDTKEAPVVQPATKPEPMMTEKKEEMPNQDLPKQEEHKEPKIEVQSVEPQREQMSPKTDMQQKEEEELAKLAEQLKELELEEQKMKAVQLEKEEQKMEEQHVSPAKEVDLHDLDIPTFMRKEAEEKTSD